MCIYGLSRELSQLWLQQKARPYGLAESSAIWLKQKAQPYGLSRKLSQLGLELLAGGLGVAEKHLGVLLCMYVCMYVCIYMYTLGLGVAEKNLGVLMCMYVYVYLCKHVRLHNGIITCMHTNIHEHKLR
jgi:hypothetical protein